MNKSIESKSTYRGFLQAWASITKDDLEYSAATAESILDNNLYNNSSSITYVLDLSKMRYIFISKNIADYIGYTADEFLYKGPSFTFSLIHPDDKTVLLEKVLQKQVSFINSLRQESYKDYRFSYTYRLKRADGVYIQVLKQDIVLKAATDGSPMFIIGTASDISFLKKDTHVCLSISRISRGFSETPNTILPSEGIISSRELEVVKLIIEGKNTRQIAQTLSISPNTVKNHRRHILAKMGANNMAEAINIAFSKRLIQ